MKTKPSINNSTQPMEQQMIQSAPVAIPKPFMDDDDILAPLSKANRLSSSAEAKNILPLKPYKTQKNINIYSNTSPKKFHFQVCRSAPVLSLDPSIKKQFRATSKTPDLFSRKETEPRGFHSSQFTLEEGLGQGSFSNVYKVVHKPSNSLYALKKIKRNFSSSNTDRSRVRREVELGLWDHPTIVRYIAGWTEENDTYILSELCQTNLPSFICSPDQGVLTEPQIWTLLCDIASALFHLHEALVVHHDVKPENILINVTPTGPIFKLGDFGCAYKQGIEPSPRDGDNRYLAPEFVNSSFYEVDIDGRPGDIYSLGVTLFQLVCDFQLSNSSPILSAMKTKGQLSWDFAREHLLNIDQISHFSHDLECVIQQMTLLDPSQRPTASRLLNEPRVKSTHRPFEIFLTEATPRSACEDVMEDIEIEQLKKPKKESPPSILVPRVLFN